MTHICVFRRNGRKESCTGSYSVLFFHFVMLMKLNGCFLEMKRLCVLLLFIVNNNYFVRATKDDWPSVNDRDLFSCSSSNNLWIQSKFPTATALDIDEQCLNHTRQYLDAYRNRRSWAVKSKLFNRYYNLTL